VLGSIEDDPVVFLDIEEQSEGMKRKGKMDRVSRGRE